MISIKKHAYFSDIRSNKFQGTKVSDCLITLFIFAYNVKCLMEQVLIFLKCQTFINIISHHLAVQINLIVKISFRHP